MSHHHIYNRTFSRPSLFCIDESRPLHSTYDKVMDVIPLNIIKMAGCSGWEMKVTCTILFADACRFRHLKVTNYLLGWSCFRFFFFYFFVQTMGILLLIMRINRRGHFATRVHIWRLFSVLTFCRDDAESLTSKEVQVENSDTQKLWITTDIELFVCFSSFLILKPSSCCKDDLTKTENIYSLWTTLCIY